MCTRVSGARCTRRLRARAQVGGSVGGGLGLIILLIIAFFIYKKFFAKKREEGTGTEGGHNQRSTVGMQQLP